MDSGELSSKDESMLTMKRMFSAAVLMTRKSLAQFKFYEDAEAKKGIDRWLLLAENGDPALFYVPCSITALNVTVGGAVKQRKPNSSIDEYTVRARIDDESSLAEMKDGFEAAINKLKDKKDACASVAVAAGLVEKIAFQAGRY